MHIEQQPFYCLTETRQKHNESQTQNYTNDRRTIIWQEKEYMGGVSDSWCLWVGVTAFLSKREGGKSDRWSHYRLTERTMARCLLRNCSFEHWGGMWQLHMASEWGQTRFMADGLNHYRRGLSYCLLPHSDLPHNPRLQTRPAASRRTDYISQHPSGLPTGNDRPD